MDSPLYRRSETIARQFAPTWRVEQAHVPVTFGRVGFPTRVESIADLRQLVNTMQEGRFDDYMAELGGLSGIDPDLMLLVIALSDWARWFCKTFHTNTCSLPFDTMIAHLSLYTKLRAWPESASILEIGPGCGYLAFFLKQHPPLKTYAQIEVCESFYLMQASVNDWCFRDVHELAAIEDPVERDHDANVFPGGPVCRHYPWWELGAIHDTFDIITANACLNEMTPQAFAHYVEIIGKSLRPTGAVMAQCIGGGALTYDHIVNGFREIGLTPKFAANHGVFGKGKSFAVPMAVFTRDGVGLPPELFAVSTGRRAYSAQEIADLVRDRLAQTTS